MKRTITILILILMISSPIVCEAAKPLGPPIAELFKARNRIACGLLIEKLPDRKIKLRIEDYLFQRDDKLISLSVDASIFDELKIGQDYVFVFSRLRRNRLTRDEWEVNPAGPALVRIRGLETQGFYQNNAAIFALLTPSTYFDEQSADANTTRLLDLAVNDADNAAQELAVFELYLRKDLQQVISVRNAERYASLAKRLNPRLKDFLLQGAVNFPVERQEPWLGREFRSVVASHGAVLELNSNIPLLVKDSLLGLRTRGTADDLGMIDRHLYSNAPGVAKAALKALDAIDPQQALVRAKQALLSDEIHLVTRRALTTYVNQ